MTFAKLYTTKTPTTAADILNDKVLPYFEQYELPMLRILTDIDTEYCGKVEHHDYQLYLAINDIELYKDKGYVASDEWYMRTLSQNDIARVLSSGVS